MKGIKINWGALANIEEDLNAQGYSLGEKRKIWEKTKEARSLLTIKGFEYKSNTATWRTN